MFLKKSSLFKILSALVYTALLTACQAQSSSTSLPSKSDNSSSNVESQQNMRFTYKISEKSVEGPSGKLYGKLYRPEGLDKAPLVIFAHELGNTHQDGETYARFLAERDVATYVFDFAGGSSSSRSDGDTHTMSVLTEVADLEAVVEASQDWSGIDSSKITLFGASQGGLVSDLTAAKKSQQVSGLILLYPAFVIQDAIKEAYDSLSEVPDYPNYLGWFPMGRKYVTDIWDMDFYQEISSFDKPALILHGSRDWLVPTDYSKKAAQTYPHATYQEIVGAGHSFLDASFSEVSNHIWTYLESHQLQIANK
ncbi:cinnamoyl ester hydrolase [Streptococcus macacae NCTC 11558]|nr:cinnamoyl ester hydrolase [Streptococcus macacae NCTC 11558]